MDIRNEMNHVFNIKLTKFIGLYQMLDPGSLKYRGRNVYHISAACILLFMCLNSVLLNVSGLYYWTDNMSISVDCFWKAEILVYLVYKMWIVVHHSNDIWDCLSITRYDFTSFSLRNRHILDRWRGRSVWLTTMCAILYSGFSAIYLGSTLAFRNNILPIKNHDGSVGFYRQNVMNLYLFVSDETYNANYNTFYIVEALYLAMMIISFIIFDIVLITLCIALCCQMQMICSAFKSVGHKSLCDSHSSIDYTDEKNKKRNKLDLVYVELKTIIMDHQAVMEKYEHFLALFRRVMLLQIFISSFSVIALWFLFIMSFSSDDKFKDMDVELKKMICPIIAILFEIYIVCYLFGHLHNQKDSIIFALYSSNWTEMDLKCKKLILLTMKMNNANQKKLKFTRTKIVNLEMFYKIMGNCYTVVSILVNYV
ncbi:odorant receptor 46a-like [Metopolophium dirhodum]|uniref:odorant receptor 46a-like n=1 Tax=Metopolophium dirhodum TaxID=44670 RepID=UPI00298FDA43|nr:odorant receptor 46a-like [Metopolophium dirhodum]